jgi:hypothetical protein
LPTIANVDARDFSDLACWLIVQIGPISLNVTTPYAKKFKAGKKYIPGLFEGLDLPLEIEQVALLVFGSSRRHTHIGGGKVLMIADFMSTIRNEIGSKRLESGAIPEPYQLLRALQFAAMYWKLS